MDRVARFNVLAMSGRAVEASGDVDVILLDKTGTITYGNRLAASITPAPGVDEAEVLDGRADRLDPRRDARGPLDRRAGPQSASPSSAGQAARTTSRASRRSPRRSPRRSRSGPRPAPAASGRPTAPSILKGAVDAISADLDGGLPAELDGGDRQHRRPGRDAARVRRDGRVARRDRAQGHRQGGPRRALRRVPQDGHPDRDDHRRQPAHRRDDRHARPASTTSSPRPRPRTRSRFIRARAGRRPPRRDDRRRHQRRARRSPSPTSGWR